MQLDPVLREFGLRTKRRRRRRRFVATLALFFTLLIFVFGFRAHNKKLHTLYISQSDRLKAPTRHSFDTVEIDLHLFIFATEPNPELCKCLLSALILGYPTPTLVNWGKQFHDPSLRFNGSHVAKITGALEQLDAFRPEHHQHLVLMIDGYDLWFQLPPSVLHHRFRSIGRQLLNRTVRNFGPRTVEHEAISQDIMFSAEKNCGPGKSQWDQVACYGQPESPLRKDLYGTDTDVRDPVTHLPLHLRPSFLNSGFIVGPVQSMRKLMDRARQKANENSDHGGSDQRVFNEIFGEQQYWREVLRQRHRTMGEKLSDGVQGLLGTSAPLITDPHPDHQTANLTDTGGPYEFGIGLDYGLELVQSAVLSEFDGRFVVYGREEKVEEAGTGVDGPPPPRVAGLPDEIAADKSFDWPDQPLYTNMYTGSVPITIHMNGIKTMREAIWDQMWYFNIAKEMMQKKGDKLATDPWGNVLSWADICGPYEDRIFPSAPT